MGSRRLIVSHSCLGLGDAVCLTAAFRSLRKDGVEVVLECGNPNIIRELLRDNPDCLSVGRIGEFAGGDRIDVEPYLWAYEREHKPAVDKSRPRLFMDALEVAGLARPRLVWSKTREYAIREEFDKVSRGAPIIFLQTETAETYKRPNDDVMQKIITRMLSQGYIVVTHTQSMNHLNVWALPHSVSEPVVSVPCWGIRSVVAGLSACDAGMGFDSFFLHASAAMDLPFIAMLGPTHCSGRVVDYPYAIASEFPCDLCEAACFRNSVIPCQKYDGEVALAQSSCLDQSGVEGLVQQVKVVLEWSSRWHR